MSAPEPPKRQYDGAIPQAQDFLSDSQIDFLGNFKVLFEKFAVNHSSFATPTSANADEGKHTIVDLVRSPTALQTRVDEMAMYDKAVTGQKDQLFLRFQNNTNEHQWTNWQIYELGNNRYFSFLPGGFIIYFGTLATSSNNNTPGAAPTSFILEPRPKNIISAYFSAVKIAGNITDSLPFIQVVNTDSGSPNIDQILLYVPPDIPGRRMATSYFYIVIGNTEVLPP